MVAGAEMGVKTRVLAALRALEERDEGAESDDSTTSQHSYRDPSLDITYGL